MSKNYEKKLRKAAKAICFEASCKNEKGECVHCEKTSYRECPLENEFLKEAKAAIEAYNE